MAEKKKKMCGKFLYKYLKDLQCSVVKCRIAVICRRLNFAKKKSRSVCMVREDTRIAERKVIFDLYVL